MNQGPGALNRIYRLVWNESLGAFVAVAEHARGRGKRSARVGAVLAAALLGPGLALADGLAPGALPTGGRVVGGQATIGQQGSQMTVQQGSSRAALDWTSFNIGSGAGVSFVQPNAGSVALNRVTGGDVSQIQGRLQANGQVMLVNPNGIVFGAGSRVDVGGIVASSLDVNSADFMAGKTRFERGTKAGSVVNQGTISAAQGGYAALLAPEVSNQGVISAQMGTVALAAGDAVTLELGGSRLLGVKVDPATVDTLVENRQMIQADGGQVILSAGAAQRLLEQAVQGGQGATSLVEQDGKLRLVSAGGSLQAAGGRVAVEGSTVDIAGSVSASGARAGSVSVQADFLSQSGSIEASASAGHGGAVRIQSDTTLQTASASLKADGRDGGGTIRVEGHVGGNATAADHGILYGSASYSARGTGGSAKGGEIAITADSVQLRAASLDASGRAGGGRVRVGGGFHGADADLKNASAVGINASTVLRADAQAKGDGGQVVVWSDDKTVFGGQVVARSGTQAGNGGQAEVSGKGDLVFQGTADLASRAGGQAGRLLLDPRNILIDNEGSSIASLSMSDPTAAAGNRFGATTEVLSNGHVVITAPDADTGVTADTGAVYLFDSQTGALLSNLRGSHAGDHIGSAGLHVLANDNYLVLSPRYGTVSGVRVYSDSNSDAGSPNTPSSYTILSNTTASAGAVTWQHGSGGGAGLVTAANSLVGNTANTDTVTTYGYSGSNVVAGAQATVTANDRIGGVETYDEYGNVTATATTTLVDLANGNVAVAASNWHNGRGAVAWIDGSTGQLVDGSAGGTVSASTAIVGGTGIRTLATVSTDSGGKKVYVIGLDSALPLNLQTNGANRRSTAPAGYGDAVGSSVTALPGGGYVVASPQWTNGAAVYTGAVTWVDGSTGHARGESATGAAIANANSLTGDAGDAVGARSNGSVPVYSDSNYNTSTYVTTTSSGTRVSANSNGIQLLENGNYLVVDTSWHGGRGAVSFASGASGLAGRVSSTNALVGGTAGDYVGSSVLEVSGSHYAVLSPHWDNTATSAVNAGAVSWGSGTGGITGTVSGANSLVGTGGFDAVGSGGAKAVGALGGDGLRSDLIVLSPHWGNRGGASESTVAYGAVTWLDGATGHAHGEAGTGANVSASNSLVGSHAGDYVGSFHYADTRSTYGGGFTQVAGNWYALLSASVDVLSNGDYVVRSASWDSGKGAVTLGSGSSGVAGAVSSSNSLVGSTSDVYATSVTNQSRGGYSFTDTTYYLTTTGDHVGLLGQALDNGSYLAISPYWGNGRGALTWVGATHRSGVVGSTNSVVGSTQDTFSDANHSTLVTPGDRLGTIADTSWSTPTVSNTTVSSQPYTTTSVRPRGPYTFNTTYDITTYYPSYPTTVVLGRNYYTSTPVGASVSSAYGSLTTGFKYNNYPVVQALANGNVLVASASWSNGSARNAGAVTWFNTTTGLLSDGSQGGVLSSTNSLVGSHAGDLIGYRLPVDGVKELANGNFLLVNPQWHDERGAVTWGSGTAGVAGTISASNSLVGDTASTSIGLSAPNNHYTFVDGRHFESDWIQRSSNKAGDQVGAGGVTALADGNAAIASPFWSSTGAWDATGAPSSLGAATWLNGTTGQLIDGSAGGSIGAGNSLIGSQAGDAVSYSAYVDGVHYVTSGITALAGGRYAVASPWWSNGGTAEVGAVTFVPSGGLAGTVTTANSLVGATAGDHVGRGVSSYDPYSWAAVYAPGVVALSDGSFTNYLVRSVDWTNTADGAGGGHGAGAVTWVDGSNGHAYAESGAGAVVSWKNSLVGNVAGDGIGSQIVALQRDSGHGLVQTGDALLLSNLAYCGEAGYGAITLLAGGVGASGPIGWRNSILGFAPQNNGQTTSLYDGWSNYTDIHYAMLPGAVTGGEQVAWRPLIWATPSAASSSYGSSALALTVLVDNAAVPQSSDQVNGQGGNANWHGSGYVADGAGYTGLGGNTGTGLLGFSANTGGDVVITPTAITGLLNAGTDVTLQASNDITVLRDIVASAGGQGGDLTLESGRTIHLNANIDTDNGDFRAIANQSVASGVVDSDCGSCSAGITQQAGTSIQAGTGSVEITVLDSTDKTNNTGGDIHLSQVDGAHITVSNQSVDANGHGRGIRFADGAVIGSADTASLTLQARGSSALGGGIVLAPDTLLQGAADATLAIGGSVASDATMFGGSSVAGAGLAMTSADVGAVLQRSTGFGEVVLGRDDQAGLTTVNALDFTLPGLQRANAALAADLTIQGGAGGMAVTGALKSGVANDQRMTLAVHDGTMTLGATSSVNGGTGVLALDAEGSGSIAQAAGGTLTADALLLEGSGSVTLAAGTNTVGTVAGHAGSANLKTSGVLTVGSVAGVNGLTTSTGMTLQASGATADVVLNQAVHNATGNLVIAADRNVINHLPTNTGIDAGAGRYLVYSANPTGTTEGMSGYSKHYNQTYTAGQTPAYAASGNWFLYSVAPTLTASVGAGSTITYGDPGALPGVSVTGFIDGDTLTSATTGSLATSTSSYTASGAGFIPVGTYSVDLDGQGSLASALGYQIAVSTGSSSFTVQAKEIDVSGLSANGKVYDGTTTASVSGTASLQAGGASAGDGRAMSGDTISISGTASGSFADRHVGTGKSVTLGGLTLSGTDAGNYVISTNSVTADITPKTISAAGLSAAATKTYDRTTSAAVQGSASLLAAQTAGSGSDDDGRSYTIDGLALTGTATGTYNSLNVADANLITFGGVTLTGPGAGNYVLDLGTQSATITPKSLTVNGVTAGSKVYDGTTAVALSGTAALVGGGAGGFVTGDSVALTGTLVGHLADANAGNGKTVITSGLSLTGADAGNYAIATFAPTADVARRTLDLSAHNRSKTYGDADPTLTYSVGGEGLASGDSLASVVGGSLATATGAAATAGTHAITQGTLAISNANYQLGAYNAGTLTVAKAQLAVQADHKSKVYGDADPALSYTVNAAQLKYGDTAGVVSGVQLATATGAQAGAGTHAITASGGTASNYDVVASTGTLTVAKAQLAIQADHKRKVYGDADPALSYTVNAAQLKYGDGTGVVSGVQLATATGAAATAGTHAITAAGGTAANYDVVASSGTLTVAKAQLGLSADDKAKTYGDADPALSYTVNAAQLKYGDGAGVVSGVQLATATGAAATAGSHAITASGGSAANYEVTATGGTLTVGKAQLTVRADDRSKVYGDADPTLTYTVDAGQLKYADTAGVVSGIGLQTALGAAATAGNHAIAASGGTAANYVVNLQDGTLHVAKAQLQVRADDARKTYGDAEPTLGYRVDTTQLKYGDGVDVVRGLTLATATGAAATAGTHAITGSGADADNYAVTVASGTLTVDKAALIVTADDQRKTYGAADPALSYSVNAAQLKYGDAADVVSGVTLQTATGAAAGAGSHAIVASGGSATNYTVTTVDGTLSVDKATLKVQADHKSRMVGAAEPTLTYTVDATQLKYGDTADVVQGISLSTPAASNPGDYLITASGGDADNYTLEYGQGILTVQPSPSLRAENLLTQVGTGTTTTGTPAAGAQAVQQQPPIFTPAPAPQVGMPGTVVVVGGGLAGPVAAGGGADAGAGAGSTGSPLAGEQPPANPEGGAVADSGPDTAAKAAPSQPTEPEVGEAAKPGRLLAVLPESLVATAPGRAISFDAGSTFQYPADAKVAFSATQADGSPLPSWLQIDPATGVLQGTPPADAPAVSLVVTARAEDGQSATTKLTLTASR